MEMSVKGRVALVTGAGRGIGRAIALALAANGADVAVNYRRDEAAAKDTVQEVEKLGRKARAYAASVENWDEDVAMVADVVRDFGRIDILVNNAGIASRGQAVADTDPAELERVLRVHAMAPHYLAKLVLPVMRQQARGDIIMISSVATDHDAANGAPYNMGKAAMEALARTLAKEERAHGIRTNIVAPSLTVTEMGKRLMKASAGVENIHDLDAKWPFGHVSTPEDVAAVVAFLVSSANTYVNGQRVAVDGGG
ncbi:MAG: SDR family oxidoreductase [Alphaproteobacteria bacterium]|nr:SDR family oxidoreductase [Alphaproteobacteria bacterium]MBN9566960.1 SDR family oxidoreductase [Alphaproteobacteria bacterium]MBN9593399.1 SDR family oxidoreductase [Alphaproteobacteria bacterium]